MLLLSDTRVKLLGIGTAAFCFLAMHLQTIKNWIKQTTDSTLGEYIFHC